MKFFGKLGDTIHAEKFGGKAYWLNWLFLEGITIPDSFFLPVCSFAEIEKLTGDPDYRRELKEILDALCGSDGVAVRSSALNEDGEKESKAGNFLTCLQIKELDALEDAVKRVVRSSREGVPMGVIVQKMIASDISGVVFSSNPITAYKKEILLSSRKGLGEDLVSGNVDADNITITVTDAGEYLVPNNQTGLSEDKVKEIASSAKAIERLLNAPVDIEWCYETAGDKVTIVQCRPTTSVFVEERIGKISKEFMESVPKKLDNSDKIKLRIIAEREKIRISDAYLVICNCKEDKFPISSVSIDRSPECRGYSVVLLYPVRISNKIIRSFIGDVKNVANATRCHRYGVRSFPDYNSLTECLQSYYDMVKQEYWVCSVIIQEILDPLYTGVVKKEGGDYIVEFAKGHFVSKGIVPMTTYVLDADGQVTYRHEITQYEHIGIIEGCTLEYAAPDDEESRIVSLPDAELKRIVDSFGPILEEKGTTVEFGVLFDGTEFSPYLIDCVKEKSSGKELDVATLKNGVISEGAIQGTLKMLDIGNLSDSLNAHFYNDTEAGDAPDADTPIIFYADLPSIKFLDILNKYDPKKIGFLFNKGSLLCHLSVLIREKGIPALIGVSKLGLKEGATYSIDTAAVPMFKEIAIAKGEK